MTAYRELSAEVASSSLVGPASPTTVSSLLTVTVWQGQPAVERPATSQGSGNIHAQSATLLCIDDACWIWLYSYASTRDRR